MTSIYVSCPWTFSNGLDQVISYIKNRLKVNIKCNRKGEDYQFSRLEQSDHIVFVLDQFRWQDKLENISRGMLTELIWCINHRIPFYLAYRASTGLAIYGAEIDDNLQFKGIAGTADNLFKIIQDLPTGGFIIKDSGIDGNIFLKGELILGDTLDYVTVEHTNYFY